MLIKSDPTATNPSPPALPSATVCSHCGAEERRLIHQVRYRGSYRRFCTTCVLRNHPQAFCPTCFEVYPPTVPNDAVRSCVKCHSLSHSRCVDSAPAAAAPPNPYVCPLCVNPSAPFFKLKEANVANCRVMDKDAAKMLLTAAKIASSSINKAAVASRAEAERKIKEAAYTRKRAKEALEHVAHLVFKEKARRKEAALGGPASVAGRGYGGIVGNGGVYLPPPVKVETENTANVGVSNRNGGTVVVPSVPRPIVAVEASISSNVGNVDRDNSNRVLAALHAVELRENEKIGIAAQGEGSVVACLDDHAPMEIGEGGMRRNDRDNAAGPIGEMSNDSSRGMMIDSGKIDEQGVNLDGVNKETVLVQSGAQPTQNKERDNGGEHV